MLPTADAPRPRAAAAYVLPLFALTLFLSAFLLFAVQPLFTKLVLPQLGGSAAVWNTAMVFFQGVLLLGYGYVHLSTRWLGLRRQTLLHALVLGLAGLALPIGVAEGWTPPVGGAQIPWLIGLLAVSIGLPFFALAATAPLLQKWFAHSGHAAAGDPYFLYGASNLGSLAALLSYPLLVEPALGLRDQSWAWTVGYALLAAAIAACALVPWRRQGGAELAPASEPAELSRALTWGLRARWLALASVPSALLLGVTLHVSTDIAAAPFLWVLPLALYLGTFVLAFARRPPVSPRWALRLQLVLVALVAVLFQRQHPLVLALHLLAMFASALVCHGELARLRPAARHLTEFYLWMSLGGLVGGFLAGILAPLVFDGVYEYPLALFLALCLRPGRARGASAAPVPGGRGPRLAAVAGRLALDLALPLGLWWLLAPGERLGGAWRAAVAWLTAAVGAGALEGALFGLSVVLALVALGTRPLRLALACVGVLAALVPDYLGTAPFRLLRERSFFGVYTVNALEVEEGRFHLLLNGRVNHGGQNMDRPLGPLSYYFREGPVGQFFELVAEQRPPAQRIGVIGLGAGALACYARHGQRMTFYEIDPLDVRIASDPRYFTYLRDAGERVEVVTGDGRLALAREPDGSLDALVLDAFTGDAVPAHLLTREAFALYFAKLKERGLLLLNVSNAYLDLPRVVGRLATDAGHAARVSRGVQPTTTLGATAGDWIVVGRRPEDVARFGWSRPAWEPLEHSPGTALWTDDFTDILQVLRFESYHVLLQ
ncbi:MAG TPA: fused MFS/spermidine synthase [Planctomycetota bacterium]